MDRLTERPLPGNGSGAGPDRLSSDEKLAWLFSAGKYNRWRFLRGRDCL
jgi:hypothetical protein